MNTFNLDYASSVLDVGVSKDDFLASVAIGNILSPNFKALLTASIATLGTMPAGATSNVTFNFDLPFSLGNIDVEPISYDTRFQGVKEFLDKPYAVAGRVVAILLNNDPQGGGVVDVKKDLDNFIRFDKVYNDPNVGANQGDRDIYLGICNSTLSDSYKPFGIVSGQPLPNGIEAIKFYDPRDFHTAAAQDFAATAQSGSTGSVSSGLSFVAKRK